MKNTMICKFTKDNKQSIQTIFYFRHTNVLCEAVFLLKSLKYIDRDLDSFRLRSCQWA